MYFYSSTWTLDTHKASPEPGTSKVGFNVFTEGKPMYKLPFYLKPKNVHVYKFSQFFFDDAQLKIVHQYCTLCH